VLLKGSEGNAKPIAQLATGEWLQIIQLTIYIEHKKENTRRQQQSIRIKHDSNTSGEQKLDLTHKT
jgi:hypothetical protein